MRDRAVARVRCPVLGAALLVGVVLAPPTVEAADAVGIGRFTGRRASRLRARVGQILRRAGYRLRRGGATPRITGNVGRAGRRWRASLTLRAAGGRSTVLASWSSRRSREVTYIPARARRRLLTTLARALPGGGRPVLAAARSAPKKQPRRARPSRAAGPARPPATASKAPASPRGDEGDPLFQPGEEAPAEEAGEAERDGQSEGDDEGDDEGAQPVRRRRGRTLALEAALSFGALSRRFAYNDVLFGGLRAPPAASAALVGGSIEWYPAAHFTRGWPTRIGLRGGFRLAVAGPGGIASNGVDYPASIASAGVGLTAWHRLWRRLALRAGAGFGVQSFTIDDVAEAPRRHESPSSELRFIQLSLGAEARIWRGLSAALSAGYLALLDTGELESDRFFPRTTGGGFEASASLSYALMLGFAVRVGADIRRFFLSFNPEPGDRNVAGGAVDQYLAISAAVVYRWRWRRR